MDDKDAEIAALKARLERLEGRPTPAPVREVKSGFSSGFFGCFGVAAAVIVAFAAFLSLGKCQNDPEKPQRTAANPAAVPVVADEYFVDVAGKVAKVSSGHNATAIPEGVYGFVYEGAPTACGHIRNRPGAQRQRFIYRNGNAVLEGQYSKAAFEDFWKICETHPAP